MLKKCLLLNIIFALSISATACPQEGQLDDATTILAADACPEIETITDQLEAHTDEKETQKTTTAKKTVTTRVFTTIITIVTLPAIIVTRILQHKAKGCPNKGPCAGGCGH